MKRVLAVLFAATLVQLVGCGGPGGGNPTAPGLQAGTAPGIPLEGAPPGDAPSGLSQPTQLCLSLLPGGGEVAGMQVDFTWDPACMAPAGAAAVCRANPDTGKTTYVRASEGMLRAIFFSISDVDPIPPGELFCCDFRAVAQSCCSLRLSSVISSSPSGTQMLEPAYTASVGGRSCGTASGSPPAGLP
jgi:hypothetical protein